MDDPSTSIDSLPRPRVARRVLALTVGASLASTGCAGLVATGPDAASTFAAVDLERPEMRQFAVASMTDLERDTRLETSGDERRREKLTPALFWTGIVLGTVGAAGTIGFAAAGYGTKVELNNGYAGDGLTVPERDALSSRGVAFNSAAIGFATAAVIGYGLALVTYGIDWNRCGPLVRKRAKRRCDVVEPTDR